MKLTDEELRIAIAKSQGWEQDYFDEDSGSRRIFWRNPANKCDIWSKPPNYPGDLNAMHEAYQTLTRDQRLEFGRHLQDITNAALVGYITDYPADFHRLADCANATARQRAEAFYLTIHPET